MARPGRAAARANRCAHRWPGGSAPWRPAGMAGRDGRCCSWRWPPAVTAGPHRAVSRSRIAARSPRAVSAIIFARAGRAAGRPRAADPLGSRFSYQGRRGLLFTTGRKSPALPLAAGLWPRGRGPRCRHGGAVAVQERMGEGASCPARVSTTSSRLWNGRPRGLTLHARPPGNLLIANPPRAPAPMADPPLWRGGCWPRCSAAPAVLRARLAGAAGASAVPRGRTKRSRPAGGPRGDRTALRPDRVGHAVTA